MTTPTTLMEPPAPETVQREDASHRVALVDGATAEVEGTVGAEALRFFAPGGHLLFEYDARRGKARVSVPDGDLEVDRGRGDFTLRGEGRVRIEGKSVRIAGKEGVSLSTPSPSGSQGAEVSLRQEGLELIGGKLAMNAARGDIRFGETRFVGETVRGWILDARLRLRRIETVAGTVIRKARDVFDTVQDLSQLQTGRLRTLVRGTWHARSRDTIVTAEREVSLDAEEIHLG